tara:strand:- start:780 stop:1130 length:351 start_codon:yes stop_codon:yes gene_type:complete
MKNNKLIAEFMGVDYVDIDTYLENNKELQYHTSWDWLMPVVKKCFDTQQPSEGQHYFINESLLTMDIEVVYDRVVEFIKEHNKYICGSCGDHVNEVVFNEDADVDECTNCTEYYDR